MIHMIKHKLANKYRFFLRIKFDMVKVSVFICLTNKKIMYPSFFSLSSACPYSSLTQGPIESRLATKKSCFQLLGKAVRLQKAFYWLCGLVGKLTYLSEHTLHFATLAVIKVHQSVILF